MIARYSRDAMAKIWSDRHRYQLWLEVELAVCEEMAKRQLIPVRDWRELKPRVRALLEKGGIDPKRVEFHEKTVHHDVIAFTTAVAEIVGPVSRYIHFGLTSSDVVDTSLSIQVQRAGALLKENLSALSKTLKAQADRYERLPTIGRSHGIFAEPTSFGLKFLGWYSEACRDICRLERALENMRYGKLSGAVGVNAHWGPDFEAAVLERLELKPEPVSTQIIPRDRHAELLCVVAIIGDALERIAIELRHLQRSEVGEVQENFEKGQKGSSAMPHKRNPISSENISGCSRLLRSYAQAALEDVALWHERDISHSSVERVAFPDAMILLDYALDRMNRILSKLIVRKNQVRANLESAGTTVFSGHFLLELVRAGATREDAYGWVQECALKSFEGAAPFLSHLENHPKIRAFLTPARIRELGSLKYQLRNVPEIYRRCYSECKDLK